MTILVKEKDHILLLSKGADDIMKNLLSTIDK